MMEKINNCFLTDDEVNSFKQGSKQLDNILAEIRQKEWEKEQAQVRITPQKIFQLQLFSARASDFYLIEFIPSWQISPREEPDLYQSDLYQGYCDYVGAYYLELTFKQRAKYLSRLHQYSQITQYQNGCFLAEQNWFEELDLEEKRVRSHTFSTSIGGNSNHSLKSVCSISSGENIPSPIVWL